MRLINRRSVTINSNIRGTWVGKLWTRSVWSDQRRLGKSRYICVQPVVTGRLIDLSNVELSLQRAAAVISDSTRAGVTRETKVARDNDHLWIFHTLDGNSKINCEMKRSWWNIARSIGSNGGDRWIKIVYSGSEKILWIYVADVAWKLKGKFLNLSYNNYTIIVYYFVLNFFLIILQSRVSLTVKSFHEKPFILNAPISWPTSSWYLKYR